MWLVSETGELHTGICCGDLREKDDLEDLGVDGSSRSGMGRHELD